MKLLVKHYYLCNMKNLLKLVAVVISVFLFDSVMAQPSGGPYGPLQKKYQLPDVSGTIYYP